jgi:hypothetical protein
VNRKTITEERFSWIHSLPLALKDEWRGNGVDRDTVMHSAGRNQFARRFCSTVLTVPIQS